MKKSETCATRGEPVKSRSSAETMLEAPIRLTPEQLEAVAAGMVASGGGGLSVKTTTGRYPA